MKKFWSRLISVHALICSKRDNSYMGLPAALKCIWTHFLINFIHKGYNSDSRHDFATYKGDNQNLQIERETTPQYQLLLKKIAINIAGGCSRCTCCHKIMGDHFKIMMNLSNTVLIGACFM